MGHLINPIAFRLGWTKNWCDSWYSELSYYPEFLHYILKIRLFLNSFFFNQNFYNASILVSHFTLKFKSNKIFLDFFFYNGLYFEYLYNSEVKDQEFLFFLKGGRYLKPGYEPHKYAPELVPKNKITHELYHNWMINNSIWDVRSFKFLRYKLSKFGGLNTLLHSNHNALFYSFFFLSFFKPFFLFDILYEKLISIFEVSIIKWSKIGHNFNKSGTALTKRLRSWFVKNNIINHDSIDFVSNYFLKFFNNYHNSGFFFKKFSGIFLINRKFFFFPRYNLLEWQKYYFRFFPLTSNLKKDFFFFYKKISRLFFLSNILNNFSTSKSSFIRYFLLFLRRRKLFFSVKKRVKLFHYMIFRFIYNKRKSFFKKTLYRRTFFKKLFFNKSFYSLTKFNKTSSLIVLNKSNLNNSKILFVYGKKLSNKQNFINNFFKFYKNKLNIKINKIYKFFNAYTSNNRFNKNVFNSYYSNNNKFNKKFNKKFSKTVFKSNKNYFLNSFFKTQLYSNYTNNNVSNSFFYNNLNVNYGLKSKNKLFAFSSVLQYRKRRFFSFFSFFFKNRFSFFKKNISSEKRYVKNRTSLYHVLFFGDYYRRSLFFFKKLFLRIDKFSFNWFFKYFSFNSLNSFVDMKYLLIVVLFFKVILKNIKSYSFSDHFHILEKISVFFRLFSKEDSLRKRFVFFEHFFSKFMPFLQFHVNPFVIDNDQVTAAFIAKYFAIKLSTGHSIKFLVNGVSGDLRSILFMELGSDVMLPRYNNVFSGSFVRYKSLVLKLYVLKSFLLYKKLSLKHFFINNTWFNFYVIWFNIWIFLTFLKFGSNFLIGISKTFFFRRYSFNFFFNYDFRILSLDLNNMFDSIYKNIFNPNRNSFLFFFVFDELFSNYNIILNYNFSLSLELSAFKAANIFFNRLLTYHYWVYNYKWIWAAALLNKRRLRIRKPADVNTFLGYKFQFRGRFSRRQRASSAVYRKGIVPLNTLSAPIDYGYSTVPLFNSLASIKVWLYKNNTTFENSRHM